MPPFTDATYPEVCARVGLAWAKYCRRRLGLRDAKGVLVIQAAIDAWPLDPGGLVPTALHALQFHIIRGGTSHQWFDTAIASARAGYGFRRCWYDDYKATRRGYPRITNRGVATGEQEALPGM